MWLCCIEKGTKAPCVFTRFSRGWGRNSTLGLQLLLLPSPTQARKKAVGWAGGSQEVLTPRAKVSGYDRSSHAWVVLASGTYLRHNTLPRECSTVNGHDLAQGLWGVLKSTCRDCQGDSPDPTFYSCMTLGRLCKLSEPPFPHQKQEQ